MDIEPSSGTSMMLSCSFCFSIALTVGTSTTVGATDPVFYLNGDRYSLNFTGAPTTRNGFSPYKWRQHYDSSNHGFVAYIFDNDDPFISLPAAGKCGPSTGGEALHFDGARTFGEVWIPNWLPLAGGNLELTVSAWVYVDEIRPGRQAIISRDKNIWWTRYGERPNPNNYGFFLGLENGYPRFSVTTVGGIAPIPPVTQLPSTKIPTARWVHLTGVYRGANYSYSPTGVAPPGRVELYRDGVLVYSAPHNFYLFYSSQRIALGATLTDPATDTWSEFFPGRIDEVKVFDVGLSPNQVRQLQTCGMPTF